jgi:hypothetical protein
MLLFGALGAFFSVALSLPKLTVNHAISVPEMLYAGFVRIPIGLIAAAVVMLMIGGGWFLSTETQTAETVHMALLAAFAAGFSESFVPNALNRFTESGGRRAAG